MKIYYCYLLKSQKVKEKLLDILETNELCTICLTYAERMHLEPTSCCCFGIIKRENKGDQFFYGHWWNGWNGKTLYFLEPTNCIVEVLGCWQKRQHKFLATTLNRPSICRMVPSLWLNQWLLNDLFCSTRFLFNHFWLYWRWLQRKMYLLLCL